MGFALELVERTKRLADERDLPITLYSTRFYKDNIPSRHRDDRGTNASIELFYHVVSRDVMWFGITAKTEIDYSEVEAQLADSSRFGMPTVTSLPVRFVPHYFELRGHKFKDEPKHTIVLIDESYQNITDVDREMYISRLETIFNSL